MLAHEKKRYAGMKTYFIGVTLSISVMYQHADNVGDACSYTRECCYFLSRDWPKGLMNMSLGDISGLHVDQNDNVWVVHRRRYAFDSWNDDEYRIPPVIVLNPYGDIIDSWGGPSTQWDWPESEHGVFVDNSNNVWIAGGFPWISGYEQTKDPPYEAVHDGMILKFSHKGDFIMQIGQPFKMTGNLDIHNFNRPADVHVDTQDDTLYVADGHGNQRIAVFNATNGIFKRSWGAYGNVPNGHVQSPKQFGHTVHCVTLATDGLVYVCDRDKGRIQVFSKYGEYHSEIWIDSAPFNFTMFSGPWDIALSPDEAQRFIFVTNGLKRLIHIFDRKTGLQTDTLTSLSHHNGGKFKYLHSVALDSRHNLYVTETGSNDCRIHKFVYRPGCSYGTRFKF